MRIEQHRNQATVSVEEAEVDSIKRINELRWVQFKADKIAAEEREAQRLKVLVNAISRHGRSNDVKRLQRSKLWMKKTIATGKALAVQFKAKEESFEEAGITETTDSRT